MGRPTKYSVEIADKICELISTTSHGLKKICEEDCMPSTVTVYSWLNNDEYIDFLNKYTRAREEQADLLSDEIIEIADDSSNDTITIVKDGNEIEVENREWVNRSKLRVDARKWKASKLAPKKYSDKLDITTKDKPINSTTFQIGFNKPEKDGEE